ncbi:Uncharacterised protein [Mycobacteroides abscessus subsp. bolletii]|nr:Uncharacterised protein [Mycobacteroides abscessus subsp. bolletii]SKG58437.1 Uncharacterised protein [Mycobacteroides abscessus subsp. bolletii]SKG81469.1 Uncharacterised protein [Mycobacteroides abscessus subsp. bolletii]SKG95862.1 Uncharacterised protein [Mycobacteroides abscessus subsp. bolletii]SKH24462.1 Uncharacterised protein [Mycobacteroides abscessus subsp. bolletii]
MIGLPTVRLRTEPFYDPVPECLIRGISAQCLICLIFGVGQDPPIGRNIRVLGALIPVFVLLLLLLLVLLLLLGLLFLLLLLDRLLLLVWVGLGLLLNLAWRVVVGGGLFAVLGRATLLDRGLLGGCLLRLVRCLVVDVDRIALIQRGKAVVPAVIGHLRGHIRRNKLGPATGWARAATRTRTGARAAAGVSARYGEHSTVNWVQVRSSRVDELGDECEHQHHRDGEVVAEPPAWP